MQTKCLLLVFVIFIPTATPARTSFTTTTRVPITCPYPGCFYIDSTQTQCVCSRTGPNQPACPSGCNLEFYDYYGSDIQYCTCDSQPPNQFHTACPTGCLLDFDWSDSPNCKCPLVSSTPGNTLKTITKSSYRYQTTSILEMVGNTGSLGFNQITIPCVICGCVIVLVLVVYSLMKILLCRNYRMCNCCCCKQESEFQGTIHLAAENIYVTPPSMSTIQSVSYHNSAAIGTVIQPPPYSTQKMNSTKILLNVPNPPPYSTMCPSTANNYSQSYYSPNDGTNLPPYEQSK